VCNTLERKKKWCAPPRRYYGNSNVYFLECIGTNAVTLSALVTRVSLLHIKLFSDYKYTLHTKSLFIYWWSLVCMKLGIWLNHDILPRFWNTVINLRTEGHLWHSNDKTGDIMASDWCLNSLISIRWFKVALSLPIYLISLIGFFKKLAYIFYKNESVLNLKVKNITKLVF